MACVRARVRACARACVYVIDRCGEREQTPREREIKRGEEGEESERERERGDKLGQDEPPEESKFENAHN